MRKVLCRGQHEHKVILRPSLFLLMKRGGRRNDEGKWGRRAATEDRSNSRESVEGKGRKRVLFAVPTTFVSLRHKGARKGTNCSMPY